MKKMITIAGILSLLVAGILFYAGIRARVLGNNFEVGRRIVADGKYYGESMYLRETITPDDIAIQQFIKNNKLDEGTDKEKVIKTFNLFENANVYHYSEDKSIVWKNEHLEMGGFDDVWEYPKFVLAEYRRKGKISVDCETGSSLLTSLFLAEGVKAKEVLGTVDIPNQGIYGHGWTIVNFDGRWYLIESTLGKHLDKFILVPKNYRAMFIFDNKDIRVISGANIKNVPPMLNESGVTKLREYLSSL